MAGIDLDRGYSTRDVTRGAPPFLASKRRVAERNEQARKAAKQRRQEFDRLRAKLRSESEDR